LINSGVKVHACLCPTGTSNGGSTCRVTGTSNRSAGIRERYSLTPADFDLINRHRTEANRLGFAIQLCLLRYPGRAWLPAEQLPSEMLRFIAGQIGAEPTALADYAQRDETPREHQEELLTAFGWKAIDRLTYRVLARWLVEIAWGRRPKCLSRT
jgi:TnpA family transposase